MLHPTENYLINIVKELCDLPNKSEAEWVEFKHNNSNPEEIGEYISALSNSAALKGKPKAYLLFGVQDITHAIVGTQFVPSKAKIHGQELENWILTLLKPKVNFRFFELIVENFPIIWIKMTGFELVIITLHLSM